MEEQTKNQNDIIVGLPWYKYIGHGATAFMVGDVLTYLHERQYSVERCLISSPCIDYSRNVLMARALESENIKFLIQIDHDIAFSDETSFAPASLLSTMLSEAEKAAVVGANYLKRHDDIATPGETWATILSSEYLDAGINHHDYCGPAKCVGFGFVVLNIEIIRKIWLYGPWFQSRQIGNGKPWITEDYRFCGEIIARGGAVKSVGFVRHLL